MRRRVNCGLRIEAISFPIHNPKFAILFLTNNYDRTTKGAAAAEEAECAAVDVHGVGYEVFIPLDKSFFSFLRKGTRIC